MLSDVCHLETFHNGQVSESREYSVCIAKLRFSIKRSVGTGAQVLGSFYAFATLARGVGAACVLPAASSSVGAHSTLRILLRDTIP